MERLSGDVLSLVLERVSDVDDRKSCSEVSTQWFTIEGLTRTRVRVLDPHCFPDFLPRFPNLTTLLAHVPMSDQALMLIGEFCPNLQTLDLKSAYSDFGNDGVVAVARGCRRLVEVSLLSRNVGDKGITALQTYAKSLSVLRLSFCHSITDASLAAIGDMESISALKFFICPLITNSGLNLLSNGPASRSLRVLTISYCKQITDVGVSHLKRMACLEELNLQGYTELTDVGGVAVSAISSLKKLDLSSQPYISNETLFAVATGCRNLVDINLYGCIGITGRGLVSLASSLPLERIDMSNLEHCRDLSSYHVVQITKLCPSLKNMIVDRGLKKGLSPLQRKKLTSLRIVEWV